MYIDQKSYKRSICCKVNEDFNYQRPPPLRLEKKWCGGETDVVHFLKVFRNVAYVQRKMLVVSSLCFCQSCLESAVALIFNRFFRFLGGSVGNQRRFDLGKIRETATLCECLVV